MKSTRATVVVVVMFVLALGAGVVAGKLTSRLPGPPAVQTADQTPLVEELQLTPAQRDQMRGIWESVRDTAHDCFAKAQDIQREHDEQVQAMLNPEQKKKYQELSKKAHDDIAQLDVQRRAALQTAIDRTRAMLNEDQRKAYDQIVKSRLGVLSGAGGGL